MTILGATVPVVREVVTSAVLANAHSGAGTSSPSFAKPGASWVGRTGWMRDASALRRRVLSVNRTEIKSLVSSSVPLGFGFSGFFTMSWFSRCKALLISSCESTGIFGFSQEILCFELQDVLQLF